MKKILIFMLIVMTLMTCCGCASKEERIANKVDYIGDWRVQTDDDEGCYILFFVLKDKHGEPVVSPANVEVRIVNDSNETVLQENYYISIEDYSIWDSPAKGEEYLAPAYIYFDDITPGETDKGKLFFTVSFNQSFYFEEISEDVSNLPVDGAGNTDQNNSSSGSGLNLSSMVGEWTYGDTYINGPTLTISQSGSDYCVNVFCMFSSGAFCDTGESVLTYDSAKNAYIAPYEDVAQGSIGQIIISYSGETYYLTVTVEDSPYGSRSMGVTNQPIIKTNQSNLSLTNNEKLSVSQEETNTFLSDFSEQEFEDFYVSSYEDSQLLEFAWTWTQLNNPNAVTYSDGYQYISASNIANTISRYFGISVNNSSTEWLTYSNNQYYAYASNPSTEGAVTIADNVNDNCDGTYTVEFTTYYCVNGAVDSRFYSYDSIAAENSYELKYNNSGKAVFKLSKYNGMDSFNLLEYKMYF